MKLATYVLFMTDHHSYHSNSGNNKLKQLYMHV